MNRRVKFAALTDADLQGADEVVAVDPNVPNFYKQMWTQTPGAPIVPGGAPDATPAPASVLEVEVDSESDEPSQLKRIVDEAKERFLKQTWDLGR